MPKKAVKGLKETSANEAYSAGWNQALRECRWWENPNPNAFSLEGLPLWQKVLCVVGWPSLVATVLLSIHMTGLMMNGNAKSAKPSAKSIPLQPL